MKKWLTLLLALAVLGSFAACSEEKEQPPAASSAVSQEQKNENPSSATSSEEQSQENSEEDDSKNELRIDLEALKTVENADTFELKVIQAKPMKGLFDNGSAVVDLNGEDGIVLAMANRGNNTIEEFTVLILCTDENGKGVDLGALVSSPDMLLGSDGTVMSYSQHVKVMGTDSAGLAPGTNEEFSIQCDLTNIANVNAMVYSYVNATGEEIVNENANAWLTNTLEVKAYS